MYVFIIFVSLTLHSGISKAGRCPLYLHGAARATATLDLLAIRDLYFRVYTGSVCFIDFEYAAAMERGFDIANHFIEYGGK